MIDAHLQATLAANLAAVRDRLARAAARSGRSPTDITLVAVSKTFGPDHVRAAFAAGQHDFGENRVQEALAKIAATPDLPVRWHLVGHLQSNKARKAVGPFACIHSVDSLDLFRRLEAAADDAGRKVEALIQVDLAGEETKSGVAPEALGPLLEAAITSRSIGVTGLMLLPPYFEDAAQTRPYFIRLRELRDALVARGVPASFLRELSMGMSHDFEVAVEEGATVIRVGTAIFGTRPRP